MVQHQAYSYLGFQVATTLASTCDLPSLQRQTCGHMVRYRCWNNGCGGNVQVYAPPQNLGEPLVFEFGQRV